MHLEPRQHLAAIAAAHCRPAETTAFQLGAQSAVGANLGDGRASVDGDLEWHRFPKRLALEAVRSRLIA